MSRQEIFNLINTERNRQNMKWGFPQKLNPMEWGSVLAEETGELCKELNDFQLTGTMSDNLVAEAVQVAAVAVSIIEHIKR